MTAEVVRSSGFPGSRTIRKRALNQLDSIFWVTMSQQPSCRTVLPCGIMASKSSTSRLVWRTTNWFSKGIRSLRMARDVRNYHGGGRFKRAAHAASDAYPSLKRVPNFFSCNYSDQREPGKRIWIRVDDKTFVERYAGNHENRFRILRSDKANDVDGIVLQISDSSLQAFIPYQEIRNDVARSGNGSSHDSALTDANSTASRQEQPKLLTRADEKSPWQSRGAMNHVE